MYQPTALTPSKPTPQLSLSQSIGDNWNLSDNHGDNFTLVVFYRGYHCPKCKEQLLEIQENLDAFANVGTKVVAISMDPDDRLQKTKDEWGLDKLKLVNGLTIDVAKQWGLHFSTSKGMTSTGVEELAQFNEPGTFLVRADGTLFASWVQTVPAGRPKAPELAGFIGFVLDKDYPPRGILTAV